MGSEEALKGNEGSVEGQRRGANRMALDGDEEALNDR